MGLKDLPILKKTVSIRRNKNPRYKKPFLPQRWDKPFQARIAFRPKPTYLFTESAKVQKGLSAKFGKRRTVMASTNIDRERSIMRSRRIPRRRRGPRKKVYLL